MAASTTSLPAAPAPNLAGIAQPGWRPWMRLLAPSISDCFFVALIAWLFVCGASGWKSLLMDGDTGWHIRTGEYILQHHAVPTSDLFSFTKAGEPWFAWEWLSDVAAAAVYHLGGLKGITLLAAALIGAFALVLLRYIVWRGANALLAAFATLLAVGSASIHFLARPHLVTLLMLPVCLWILEADRRRNSARVWILIPLTALWTNLHGGFPVFLALLFLLVLGTAVEAWMGRPRWPAVYRYSWLLAGCAAATLVNPYGARLHVHMIAYLRSDWIRNIVQEFQAPTFRSESQLQFEILLLAGLVLAGLLWKKQRISEALWILFLAHSSLLSARHAPLFAVVAAPLIASEASAWWKTAAANRSRSSVIRILYQIGDDLTRGFRWTSLWPALLIVALAFIDAPIKWQREFPSEGFPVALVQKHSGQIQAARLLTTDQWGDYMIYAFYPRLKVFVDGRSDFYGESVGRDYVHLLQGAYDWPDILRKYQFDTALLPVSLPLASLLKMDHGWQVIADDGRAILLTRLGQQSVPN